MNGETPALDGLNMFREERRLRREEREADRVSLMRLAAPFPPKDLDWRVGRDGKKQNGEVWSKVLAYVDARAVMDRLDEVVGAGNWKDRYWKEGGGTMCALAIRVGGEWVEKVDGSEDTDIEAFKGGISKALVRTGVKWGIGRYLYNLTEGFAQIVDRNKPGAHYQRSKEAGEYYWLPPPLPEWALPVAVAAGKPEGKPNGSANSEHAAAGTQARTSAVRERLTNSSNGGSNGSQPVSASSARGPAGGGAQAASASHSQEAIDSFFEGAGEGAGQEKESSGYSGRNRGGAGPAAGSPGAQDKPGSKPGAARGASPAGNAGIGAGEQVQPAGAGGRGPLGNEGRGQGPRAVVPGPADGGAQGAAQSQSGRADRREGDAAGPVAAKPAGSPAGMGCGWPAGAASTPGLRAAQQDVGLREGHERGGDSRVPGRAAETGAGSAAEEVAKMADTLASCTDLGFLRFTWTGLQKRMADLSQAEKAHLETVKNRTKEKLEGTQAKPGPKKK